MNHRNRAFVRQHRDHGGGSIALGGPENVCTSGNNEGGLDEAKRRRARFIGVGNELFSNKDY